MRRDSVAERFVKCSKAGCACATDPKARHGPCFSLARAVKGSTRSRFLTPRQDEIATRRVQAGHEFSHQEDACLKRCEQWAGEEPDQPPAASAEAASMKARGELPSRDRRRSETRPGAESFQLRGISANWQNCSAPILGKPGFGRGASARNSTPAGFETAGNGETNTGRRPE
jgi:hypothetical protein